MLSLFGLLGATYAVYTALLLLTKTTQLVAVRIDLRTGTSISLNATYIFQNLRGLGLQCGNLLYTNISRMVCQDAIYLLD